ncbi:MAG: hypothetical protein MHPSP_000955, partial [Paramarteilia canceri]
MQSTLSQYSQSENDKITNNAGNISVQEEINFQEGQFDSYLVAIRQSSKIDENNTQSLTEINLLTKMDISKNFTYKYRGQNKDCNLILLPSQPFSQFHESLLRRCGSSTKTQRVVCHGVNGDTIVRSFMFWTSGNYGNKTSLAEIEKMLQGILIDLKSEKSYAKFLKKIMRKLLYQDRYIIVRIAILTHDLNGPNVNSFGSSSSSNSSKTQMSSFSNSFLKEQCLELLEAAYPDAIHINELA